MNLLIIDTETTGLDPNQGAECIEIGAILYSVPHRAILAQCSTLLPVKENGQQDIHGIGDEANDVFYPHGKAISLISSMVINADYAVAHNAPFDQQFSPKCIGIPWLCTYEDFRFTPHKPQALVNLALAHGITVKSAHRALNDCGLIAEILGKRDDLEALIDAAIIRARSPKVWVKALVKYQDRHLAKAAHFEWKDESKSWVKLMKECDLDSLNFDWELIDETT